jgi:hypothetical protein
MSLPVSTAPAVYALHENPDWFGPFREAFEAEGVPLVEWLLVDGELDLDAAPPQGVFWSRISASSHTRGHAHSKDFARSVLSWLESHGRRTVNGRRVLELEVSKVDQLTALRAAGIDTPRTLAVVGVDRLLEAAADFPAPFLTKHNQGGKGLGVQRFESAAELAALIGDGGFEEPVDGIVLLQEYLVASEPAITRVELVDGELVYAVRADTALGGFELCPADACVIDPVTGAELAAPIFRLREGFRHPLVERYREFTRRAGIEIAGIEFIETVDGRAVTYDVNTNTNYNADVEAAAPLSGPRQIARFLGRELAARYAAVG